MNVKSITLSEVAEFNPPAPVLTADEEVSFVPMAAVSELGVMQVTEHARVADLKSGYSYMRTGDVLVAKITPCFENNKIAVASLDRPHGYGSTEFHVIRPRKEKLEARFLVHFLRQDQIRTAGERRMTGSAGQRRVPKQFLGELAIPLPSLDEQRRIAAILDQADDLRRKRREALGRLDQLSVAVFRSAFASQVGAITELGKLCDLVRGSSPRPQGDPRYFGGPVPRLMIADITRDGMRVTPSIDSLTIEGARKSRPMEAGSVVMAVSGAVGLPAILEIDACIHDGFVGFRKLDPIIDIVYFYYWLYMNKVVHSASGTGAIWSNLTTEQVAHFRVPVPPLPLQRAFAARVAEIDKLKAHHRAHLARLDALFASLQHRAFRGDLSAPSFSRAREKAAAP